MNSSTAFKRPGQALATLAVVLTSGCASPVLQSMATNEPGASGLVYALPKAQILVQASRRKVDAAEVDAAKKDADDTAAVSKTAASSAKEAEQQLKALETEVTKAEELKVGADASADVKRRRDLAKVLAALAKAKADTAAATAKKAADAYDLVRGQVGKWVESGSLTPQAHAPDTSRRFVATHAASPWRDDALTLNVVDGMLSTSESKATGQAANIILNLVRSVAALSVSSAPAIPKSTFSLMTRADGDKSPAAEPACKGYDLAFVFDPTDSESWKFAQSAITASGSNLALSDLSAPVGITDTGSGRKVVNAPSSAVNGLVYRVPRRVTLELGRTLPRQDQASGSCVPNGPSAPARVTVSVPDAATLYVLPVMGATMTKSSIKHVFKDGMLTELSLDQPSTLAAVAGLPVDILKALVSIPAEIIKLRVDYSTQEKAELDGQVKLIEAQIAMLKAQRDLQAAQGTEKP